MKNLKSIALVAGMLVFGTGALLAQDKKMMTEEKKDMKMNDMSKKMNPEVGGAPMYANKNIVENAINSKDHTTLVAAVKAAGLVETLQGEGPFTVFAPTNAAFEKLPKGTVETLLKPENKKQLQEVLTYHVIAGKMDAKTIAKAIKDNKGTARFTTVNGGKLTAMMDGKNLVLTDENKNTATVTIANVYQSNGVIHVVDTVVLPGAKM
ncbi:fasciclin domain-containing protein [Cochleicola gelatinilyticus]